MRESALIIPLDLWRENVERIRSRVFAEVHDDDLALLDGAHLPVEHAETPEAKLYRLAYAAELRARRRTRSGPWAAAPQLHPMCRCTLTELDFSL